MKLTDQLLSSIGWATFPGGMRLKSEIEGGPDVPRIMFSPFHGHFIAPVQPLEKEIYSLYSRPLNHSFAHAFRFPDVKTSVMEYIFGSMYDPWDRIDQFRSGSGLGYIKWNRASEAVIFGKHYPGRDMGASFGLIRQQEGHLERISGAVEFKRSAALRLDDDRFQAGTPEEIAAYLESRGMDVKKIVASQLHRNGGMALAALDEKVLAESIDYSLAPVLTHFDPWDERVVPLKGTDYRVPFSPSLQNAVEGVGKARISIETRVLDFDKYADQKEMRCKSTIYTTDVIMTDYADIVA